MIEIKQVSLGGMCKVREDRNGQRCTEDGRERMKEGKI